MVLVGAERPSFRGSSGESATVGVRGRLKSNAEFAPTGSGVEGAHGDAEGRKLIPT